MPYCPPPTHTHTHTHTQTHTQNHVYSLTTSPSSFQFKRVAGSRCVLELAAHVHAACDAVRGRGVHGMFAHVPCSLVPASLPLACCCYPQHHCCAWACAVVCLDLRWVCKPKLLLRHITHVQHGMGCWAWGAAASRCPQGLADCHNNTLPRHEQTQTCVAPFSLFPPACFQVVHKKKRERKRIKGRAHTHRHAQTQTQTQTHTGTHRYTQTHTHTQIESGESVRHLLIVHQKNITGHADRYTKQTTTKPPCAAAKRQERKGKGTKTRKGSTDQKDLAGANTWHRTGLLCNERTEREENKQTKKKKKATK